MIKVVQVPKFVTSDHIHYDTLEQALRHECAEQMSEILQWTQEEEPFDQDDFWNKRHKIYAAYATLELMMAESKNSVEVLDQSGLGRAMTIAGRGDPISAGIFLSIVNSMQERIEHLEKELQKHRKK